MAATRKANVIICDSTGGSIPMNICVEAVLYVPGTGSPTAVIAAADGTTVWEASGATRLMEQFCLCDSGGITVTLAGNGTKLYLYTE